MARTLTASEAAILNFAVPDAQAWFDHAVAEFGEPRGEAALAAKLAKWRPAYDHAVATLGAAYKTRAERRANHRVTNIAMAEAKRRGPPA